MGCNARTLFANDSEGYSDISTISTGASDLKLLTLRAMQPPGRYLLNIHLHSVSISNKTTTITGKLTIKYQHVIITGIVLIHRLK